jgi:predicted alpha/beta-hydrolase family hydrolase
MELQIPTPHGDVAAIALLPAGAEWLYVLAHGAGAGMRHRFMEAMAGRLADHAVGTLRYEYPYMSAGSKRPDPASKNEAVTRAVCEFAGREFSHLTLCAGGKSMGGRMTSQAQAAAPLPRIEALVFLGFPLHAPGRPAAARGEHLERVNIPMLFFQGTRDSLADLTLLEPICTALGERATLHVITDADHSFAVLKRSGRTADEVLDEIAETTAAWLRGPATT